MSLLRLDLPQPDNGGGLLLILLLVVLTLALSWWAMRPRGHWYCGRMHAHTSRLDADVCDALNHGTTTKNEVA